MKVQNPVEELLAIQARLECENRQLREELDRVIEERDVRVQPSLLRQVLAGQELLARRLRRLETLTGARPENHYNPENEPYQDSVRKQMDGA